MKGAKQDDKQEKLAGVSAACLLAFPLALSGCGWFGSEKSAAIDPPPSDVEAQMLQTSDNTLDSGVFAPVAEDGADSGSTGSDSGGAQPIQAPRRITPQAAAQSRGQR